MHNSIVTLACVLNTNDFDKIKKMALLAPRLIMEQYNDVNVNFRPI